MKNNYYERIKVLSTLSLAATDAREDTLASVIVSTLNEIGKIEKGLLTSLIEDNFGFKPYLEEVNVLLKKLDKEGKIEFRDGQLNLTENERAEIKSLEIEARDKDKARFNNFKDFIENEGFESLDGQQIRKLWAAFLEYLYINFFDYGEDALKRLHPNISYDKEFKENEDYLQAAYKKLKDKKLNPIFKIAIDKFPDYASQDDIDFLNDLAQKTLSFASLGIDPKLTEAALDISLVDWVLYLDTNVLYSILNLHFHPENEATKALINLINSNKEHLNVTLRYSELTKKELRSKKDEFNQLNEKLTDSGIRAAVNSNRLDEFSKQYYEGLLNNRDETLHPSKVIEISSSILVNSKIDIARNSKRLEHLGEDYLNEKIQEYRRYIDQKNDYKEDFYKSKGLQFHNIYKSDKQITHDISLRELIFDLRHSVKKKSATKELDFNSIKYFGLTLDSLLIDYDIHQIRQYEDERSFPVFFKPSYLLNRLVRILPVQTSDYKKAFLKAVTSRGFNKDARKSRDVLKIINYLKSQGIDDEKVIQNLISKDLFLEKYSQYEDKSEKEVEEFFESELNKQFSKKQKELEVTRERLFERDTVATTATEKTKKLESKKTELESDVEIFKRALTKLKFDFRKLEKNIDTSKSQISINFEAEESKRELESSRSELDETQRQLLSQYELEANKFKISKLKTWQKKIWWNLIWVIPFTIFILTIIINPKVVSLPIIDRTAVRVVLGFLLLIIDGIFIRLINARYWDENNKSKKKENLEIPAELQSKIDSLTHRYSTIRR